MPVRTETRHVAGHEIEMTHLPLVEARRTLVRLAQLVGPALSKSLAGAESIASLKAMQGEAAKAIADGLGDLLTRIDDADLETLAETFGKACVLVEGDKRRPMRGPVREDIFAGRLTAFFAWLLACAEYQYADFWDALDSLPASAPASKA